MEFYPHPLICVDDDADTCDLIEFVLAQAGYTVQFCSQSSCLKLLREKKIAAVILDNYLGDIKGTDICRQIRNFDQFVPVIFFSGEARPAEIDRALAAGADLYLIKPNDFEELSPSVIRLIRRAAGAGRQVYPEM